MLLRTWVDYVVNRLRVTESNVEFSYIFVNRFEHDLRRDAAWTAMAVLLAAVLWWFTSLTDLES